MFGAYVESGTVLNNYAHIFDLLIRLRQAVCHPYLVVHSATAPPGEPLLRCQQALVLMLLVYADDSTRLGSIVVLSPF
jgi:SNF2 family DNA or RNA helicase